jgi:hypothetical protein
MKENRRNPSITNNYKGMKILITKNTIKSINSVEGFLILIFIILISGILILIGAKYSTNTIIYNILVLSLMLLTALVSGVGIFQYVKYKYVETIKNEIMEDLDRYINKSDSKVNETNNRIYGFETNYSKKLKKISKDYSLKAKEISDIKKELDDKLLEIDRKAAYFEIEFCNMKAENIRSKNGEQAFKKEVAGLYNRIIELNSLFPGISTDEFLEAIHLHLSKIS